MDVFEALQDLINGETYSVGAGEYDDKTIARNERDNLLNLLFEDMGLSYDKETLVLKHDGTLAYLKAVYPNRFQKRFKELKDAQTD